MKNTKTHMASDRHSSMWIHTWLILLTVLSLGCSRSTGCQDDAIICADEVSVATSAARRANNQSLIGFTLSHPSGASLDVGQYGMNFRHDRLTASDYADIAPNRGVFYSVECSSRFALSLYDSDRTLGTMQKVEICIDESCNRQDCGKWVDARRAKPVLINSEALAQKYGATVHCQKLEFNGDHKFPEFTWRALSSQSLTFPEEPRVISTAFGIFKQVRTTKGSDMNDHYTPHIENGKEIVADTSYRMVLPIRQALSELIPGSGTDYPVLRAGFTFGGTTLGCNIEQKKLHAILTKALGDKLLLEKGKTLHVLFPSGNWLSTAGGVGWCFKITDVGAQPMFKPFDENTDGTECLTE